MWGISGSLYMYVWFLHAHYGKKSKRLRDSSIIPRRGCLAARANGHRFLNAFDNVYSTTISMCISMCIYRWYMMMVGAATLRYSALWYTHHQSPFSQAQQSLCLLFFSLHPPPSLPANHWRSKLTGFNLVLYLPLSGSSCSPYPTDDIIMPLKRSDQSFFSFVLSLSLSFSLRIYKRSFNHLTGKKRTRKYSY